LKSIV